MFRTAITASLLALFLVLTSAQTASADEAKAQQYEQLARYYDQLASQYASYNPTFAKQLRDAAAQYRALAAKERKAKTSPPPPPKKPAPPKADPYKTWLQQSAQSRTAAMNWLARNKPGPRGGYIIRYKKYGVQYPAYRDWYVKAYEAQRTISSLTNNGAIIIGMGRY